MRLSDRLQAMADEVNRGETLADIGTDHGYLPIYLKKIGRCPHVILSDISRASLEKALKDCELYDPGEKFDIREGDGLKVLKSAEVDVVSIAGMGGILISDILGYDIKHSRSFRKFILQPRNNLGRLRLWLYDKGFKIEKEIIVKEGKFLPSIFVVTPSHEEENLKRTSNESEDFSLWEYPDSLINNKNQYTQEYLLRELTKHIAIKKKIGEASEKAYASQKNIDRIKKIIGEL
ncbi:MAG: class I SAM-dependent methyltransferase [Hornefia sp.]|nr:class I SAM-dependent methyltransferase [Hornefia sp.]